MLSVRKHLFDIMPGMIVNRMEYAPEAAWNVFVKLQIGVLALDALIHFKHDEKSSKLSTHLDAN